MQGQYVALLADFQARRAKLESEIRDLDAAILGIQRLMGLDVPQAPPTGPSLASSPLSSPTKSGADEPKMPPPNKRFSNISVRWGVLWFLDDNAQTFVKTGEIASALLAGGYKSQAIRFPNMVSAVLSSMKERGEVETRAEDGGYRLTEQGRKTWDAIRHGARFRFAISPNEQTLLSVQ